MDLEEESKDIDDFGVLRDSKLSLLNGLEGHQGLVSFEINLFLWRIIKRLVLEFSSQY